MFRKVHIRLCLLCAGITIFILLAMSFGYLYISEQGLRSNHFISFQNDMNTVLSNLEQQTEITYEWLTRIEAGGKYRIRILDNGVPLHFSLSDSETERLLFEQAWEICTEDYPLTETTESYGVRHVEFPFSSSQNRQNDYYACAALSDRHGAELQILILSSLDPLEQQIRNQRILFLLLDVFAVAALSLFAWHFTKRLLMPLEESRIRQEQFVASASHELRTPLAAILSCASASEHALGEERRQFLNAIQSEGKRMSRLIDDMLLLARADQQSWDIRKKETETDTLLLDVYEAYEPLAREKSIRLSIQLPDTALSPCLCDPERIRQILGILIHNAVSYTPSGGQIRLTLSGDGHHTRFSVTDNGIGMPDAEKKRIFERFYRADQSRSEKGHFGLGLSIAAQILKAHGGRLTVEDTPGGGSTFILTLP